MISTQNMQRILIFFFLTHFFKLAKFMQCFNIVFVIQQHLLIEEVLISNDFFLPLEISAVFIYVNIKFLVKSTNSHKQKKKKLNHTYIYWWIKCPTYSPHHPNSRTHFFHKVIVTYILVLKNNLLKFACSVDIMSISPKDAKLLSHFISP